MAAVLAEISGTVSISLDGHDELGVGTFTVPVTTSLDATTGTATLNAAPTDAIKAAMAAALHRAADELLDSIPSAIVETIAVCPTCDAELGVQDPTTAIVHGEDGAHIMDARYTR